MADEPHNQPGPITDQPLDIEAITRGAGGDKPVDEGGGQEAAKEPGIADILKTIADQQRQFGETLAEIAKTRPVERIIERPAPVEATVTEKPAGWRAKVAAGNDAILEEAVTDLIGKALSKYEKEQLLPTLGHFATNQERLMERDLATTYDDPQFGFEAMRQEVGTYQEEMRRQGKNVSLEAAYEKVSQREMYKAVRAAQASDRTRQVKQDVTDEGKRGTQREAPVELDAQEKQAAWAFFPSHPTDPSKPWTHADAEKMFLQQKVAAARDRMLDKDEVPTR